MKRALFWVGSALAVGSVIGVSIFLWGQEKPIASFDNAKPVIRKFVGALGRIEPRSRVIRVSHDVGPEGAWIADLRVKEGDTVKKGDVIAVFGEHARKEAALNMVKAKILSLEAQIRMETIENTFTKKEFHRHDILFQKKAGPGSKRDEALRNWHKSKAKLDALNADLVAMIAEKNLAQERVQQTLLHAPIGGTIVHVGARTGERVGSDGVVEIADLSHLEVVADVYEQDFSSIRDGQKATIEVRGMKTPVSGTVTQRGFIVGKSTLRDTNPTEPRDQRTIEVRIALEDSHNPILQHSLGMQVYVRFAPEKTSSSR